MAEQMTLEVLQAQERLNTGTSWTRNEDFDKNGYLVIKDLWDPKELYSPVPELRGQLNYWDKNPEHFSHIEVERQVEGSTARYWHPQYRAIHVGVRKKLEEIIGRELYNTYYYDRYYFPGQELTKHADRDACEISVSIHIGTNLEGNDADWPFCIKTPDTYTDKSKKEVLVPGENRSLVLKPGDGLLYKGCERPHWRDAMPTPKRRKRDIIFRRKEKEYYYHQIFFHYVLADGERAHCAWDRSR
jgi:hypothetical protein|tara:strand:+ start:1283 stop:2014 length:732 start_codon:yes stop_codon:yes gene_type:complete